MYNSGTFNRVTGLCTHHLSLVASRFHHLKRKPPGVSVIQWLRLRDSTARVLGLAPDQGTKFPHGRWCGQKSKTTATITKKSLLPMKQSVSIFPASLVYIFYIYESTSSGVPANGIIQYVDLYVWFLFFFYFLTIVSLRFIPIAAFIRTSVLVLANIRCT